MSWRIGLALSLILSFTFLSLLPSCGSSSSSTTSSQGNNFAHTATPTQTPVITATPTTVPDLSVDIWATNSFGSTNPLILYATNSLTNPTYTNIQSTGNSSGYTNNFTLNIPTADSPVYVEMIYAYEGQSYASTGTLTPHVGDIYGYYQASPVSFMSYATTSGWTGPNVSVTSGTPHDLGSGNLVDFGASNWGGAATQTGWGGAITLTNASTVNSTHPIYVAAYPDSSMDKGCGSATHSGTPLLYSSSSVNGAWQDLRDTTFSAGTTYYVQAWYDSNDLGSTGCVSPGVPCPHDGDPIYVCRSGSAPQLFYVGTTYAQYSVTLTNNILDSCSALGEKIVGTTSNTNTGGLLFQLCQTYGAASVNQMQIYLTSSTEHYEVGIYSQSGSYPGSLLAESGYQTASATGWNTVNLQSTVSLSAQTYYYIGFYTDGSFLSSPTSIEAVNNYSTGSVISNVISSYTPGSTTTGADNLPTYSGNFPTSGTTYTPLQYFGSVGAACN